MAQSDNVFNLRGKIGDLIFFTRNGKTFVKRKSGGFVNGKSNEHPNTKAVQQNFSEVASLVKRFKEVLFPILWKQKDGTFHNQLVALFFKLKKMAPDQQLYTAFEEGYALRELQYTSFNKNSVLNGRDCFYDRNTNTLKIDPFLIQFVKKKYPEGYLELNMAWLSLSTTLEMELNEVSTAYISLKEMEEGNSPVEIPFPVMQSLAEELVFPLVSLIVVVQPHQSAVPYHPYRYSLITMV